ncbi:MAG TPA: hypothetical protein VGD08_16130 [Stellaceae bacterium]|jgi:hypothetical protein
MPLPTGGRCGIAAAAAAASVLLLSVGSALAESSQERNALLLVSPNSNSVKALSVRVGDDEACVNTAASLAAVRREYVQTICTDPATGKLTASATCKLHGSAVQCERQDIEALAHGTGPKPR